MNTKIYGIVIAIIALVLASLACQTVMGAISPEEDPEVIAPLPPEEEEPEPIEEAAEPEAPAADDEPDTGAPGKSSPGVTLGEEYRSEEGGYAFATLPDYEVEEFFGMTSMEAPDAHPEYGPSFFIVGGLNEEEITIDQIVDDFTDEITGGPDAQLELSEQETVSVSGVEGVLIDVAGEVDDQPVAGRIFIALPTPMQQFTIFGFSPGDEWDDFEPYYDAVLESITFFEPTEMELDFELDDEADVEEAPAAEETPVVEEIRQWASSAEASSEWDNPDWAAIQAIGEPDTLITACEDATTAWASYGSDTIEWLEVGFEGAVVPTEINIIQTHSPDQVVKVEVVDLDGVYTTVYTGEPENLWEQCPYTLSVPVDVDFPVMTVKITIDQSIIDPTWNEIDAVELVGYIPGSAAAPAEPAVGTTEGVLWRIGGEDGTEEGQYGGLDGLDVSADGLLYVTDTNFGIRVLDVDDGSQVNLISHDDLWQPTDIQVGPDGNVYVADWGANEVFVFSSDGNLLTRFGEDGNGPGQFGTFSPDSLVLSPNGELFVLDDNETDAEEQFTRIQVFDTKGSFLREFPIEGEESDIEEMAFGPNGNLYLVNWFNDIILEYSPMGDFIGRIAEEALDWASPRDAAIDDAGNIYVATWSENGVMKIDPDGNLVAQFGAEVEDGEKPWAEGGFYSLYGIAVTPDGSKVFVSDWSGYYSYITAFEYK